MDNKARQPADASSKYLKYGDKKYLIKEWDLPLYDKFNAEEAKEIFGKFKAYYHSGKFENRTSTSSTSEECFKILRSNDEKAIKELFVEWGEKEFNNRFDPNVNQLIPKNLWTSVKYFQGNNATTFCHPHFNLLYELFLETVKPKSENLLVLSCSGAKPYSKVTMFQPLLKFAQRGYVDIIINSTIPAMIWPNDMSVQYPCCFYDLPHDETDSFADFQAQQNALKIFRLIQKCKYKKVIFCHIKKTFYEMVCQHLKELSPDTKIINLIEDTTWHELTKRKFTNIAFTHYASGLTTRECILEVLGKRFDGDARRDIGLKGDPMDLDLSNL